MDNEITINGEVYVKKNLDVKEKLKKFAKMWGEEHSVKPWPQEGDEYWYMNEYGEAEYCGEYPFEGAKEKIKLGNFFQTKEEAEMYSLRIESLSKGFIPKDLLSYEKCQEFWIWDFLLDKPMEYSNTMNRPLISPKFPTKEECQEWYDSYGHAWTYLLTKDK